MNSKRQKIFYFGIKINVTGNRTSTLNFLTVSFSPYSKFKICQTKIVTRIFFLNLANKKFSSCDLKIFKKFRFWVRVQNRVRVRLHLCLKFHKWVDFESKFYTVVFTKLTKPKWKISVLKLI